MTALPILHVCVTCCPVPDGVAQGQRLYDAVQAEIALRGAPSATLRPVTCLWNCARGCSAAVAMPGKWSFLLGHLAPGLAADLLAYVAAYAATPTGGVMPSRRPASLRAAILGRTPPLDAAA